MNSEEMFTVIITDQGVACEHSKRKREYIAWNEIEEIVIITTDDGPWFPDVWLGLIGKSSGCIIPQGAKGYDSVYDRVSRWHGFDYDAVIDASTTTNNAKFACWKKK